MNRVFEKRVKVEQHVDAGLRHGAYVLEDITRFRVERLRFQRYIEALQPVGYGPAKQRHVVVGCAADRDRLEYVENSRLFLRLDDDDRGARFENDLEVVSLVLSRMTRYNPGTRSSNRNDPSPPSGTSWIASVRRSTELPRGTSRAIHSSDEIPRIRMLPCRAIGSLQPKSTLMTPPSGSS